jgi:hypothetical protein
MRFYKLDEIPVEQDEQVFKVSPVDKAIATVIFFGIAITSLVAAITKWIPHGTSPIMFYVVAAVFGLIALLPLGMFRASVRPSNWLFRCRREGIIIKYRAYENWRLPADTAQAVGFDYGEIASVKIVKEWRKTPSMSDHDGSQISHLTYVELNLVNTDTSDLEAHLSAETNLRPDGIMVTLDYPVQVLPGGIVDIRWNGGVRPSVHKAVAILGQRVKILEKESRKVDLTYHRNAKPEDERATILKLAKSGDEMAAVKLAREAYGYSLTEATQTHRKGKVLTES